MDLAERETLPLDLMSQGFTSPGPSRKEDCGSGEPQPPIPEPVGLEEDSAVASGVGKEGVVEVEASAEDAPNKPSSLEGIKELSNQAAEAIVEEIGSKEAVGREVVDGEEEWVVQKVLGKWVTKGVIHYQVKWQGWGDAHNTWEPLKNLENSKELIEEFEREEKLKKLANQKWKKSGKKKQNASKAVQAVPESTEALPATAEVEKEKAVALQPQRKTRFSTGVPLLRKRAPTKKVGRIQPIKQEGASLEAAAPEPSLLDSPKPSTSASAKTGGAAVVDLQKAPSDIKKEEEELGGPTFRLKWRPEEVPLCILGSDESCETVGTVLHFVRLKPPNASAEEIQAILQDPYSGLTVNNSVIVPHNEMKAKFPDLVINYLMGCRRDGEIVGRNPT